MEPDHSCYQCGARLGRAVYLQVNFENKTCEVAPLCPLPEPCSRTFRILMNDAGLEVFRTIKEKWEGFPCP